MMDTTLTLVLAVVYNGRREVLTFQVGCSHLRRTFRHFLVCWCAGVLVCWCPEAKTYCAVCGPLTQLVARVTQSSNP